MKYTVDDWTDEEIATFNLENMQRCQETRERTETNLSKKCMQYITIRDNLKRIGTIT